jgi:hypothetical protein
MDAPRNDGTASRPSRQGRPIRRRARPFRPTARRGRSAATDGAADLWDRRRRSTFSATTSSRRNGYRAAYGRWALDRHSPAKRRVSRGSSRQRVRPHRKWPPSTGIPCTSRDSVQAGKVSTNTADCRRSVELVVVSTGRMPEDARPAQWVTVARRAWRTGRRHAPVANG